MTDPRVEKLARLITAYSTEIKAGDKVAIIGELEGLPLLRALYRESIRAGALAMLDIRDDETSHYLLRNGSDEQIAFIRPAEQFRADEADVSIYVRATGNTRAQTSIDPARDALFLRSRQQLAAERSKRTAAGKHRWNLTQFPTEAYAQEAGMSLEEFEDFVYKACFVDQPDPIQSWHNLKANQQKYVDWLAGKKHIEVRGPNIDMRLSIEGRTFVNSEGTRNMPSGEIFTGPVEQSAEGWARFSNPSLRSGRSVEGVELRFDQGKVIDAKAARGEDFLLSQLETDAGARYLGEWAIGTNYGITRFTGNILFDEKIGGTIHMALGNSYPETGGLNKSAVHWDMICDMRRDSEIRVDGDLLYKDGNFAF